MEDPENEVKLLVRGLVDKPTLRRQGEVLKKYFTPDVEFYHMYLNTNTGLRALIAIYQMAHFFLNYSGVEFHTIVYDEPHNYIAVRMTVAIRPWLLLWRTIPLKMFALLQLQDVIVGGKTVKKVKVQRDYFIRNPMVQLIPCVGDVYNSESLRFFLGNFQAFVFQFVQWLIVKILPAKIWHGWLGLYSYDIAFHGQ